MDAARTKIHSARRWLENCCPRTLRAPSAPHSGAPRPSPVPGGAERCRTPPEGSTSDGQTGQGAALGAGAAGCGEMDCLPEHVASGGRFPGDCGRVRKVGGPGLRVTFLGQQRCCGTVLSVRLRTWTRGARSATRRSPRPGARREVKDGKAPAMRAPEVHQAGA
ncbi:unnamed protein product [Amoebophrya sp. A120]|nr:unnamed protein product [Amoebophrya sp. A120]|eukprot:GSA120T00001659001.1